MTPDDRYTHGHHESVLRSHRWRTVENSVAFLVPWLTAGRRVLDVGCGPATITADIARRVAPGPVIGVDASPEVIATAREEFAHVANLDLRVDDVYDLALEDASVDVVLAHQVLQHLSDPVAALGELRRVVAPDGVVAARDADFAAFAWYPEDARLTRWMEIYHQVTARNGAQCDAGRRLLSWADDAGFTRVEASSSNWTFADPEGRAFWGGLWADRVRESAFAHQAIEYGLSDEAELADVADAFRAWANSDDGVFLAVNGEVLARP